MGTSDGLLLCGMVLALCGAMLALAKRVASLEEDMDLMNVAAGNPGTLLEAKRAIEKRAVARAEERGLA
jgi:hypothetical protein